jgi:hypothetical protein
MGIEFGVELARAALLVGPSLGAAVIVRRRRHPALARPEAALATAILALAAVLGISHLAGAIDRFEAPTIVGLGLVVLAASLLLPQVAPTTRADDVPAAAALHVAVMVGTLAVVAGQWATRVADAFAGGISDYDSLHYHLPFAARFVQTGSLGELHYANATGVPNVFHPLDSELLHALGMLAFDNDVASPLLNLGWAALAVLAAWCVGRPFGSGPLSVVGQAVVLSLPITALGAGSALNDVPSYACLLAVVVFLLQPVEGPHRERLVLAGLAAGLAISMKLTLVAPIGVLTLGVLWLWRRRPADALLGWCLPLAATGSFWYLRSIAATGSPIPGVEIPGLPHARFASVTDYGFSVASYLDRPEILREWFVPGLAAGSTRAWPLLIGLALAITVLSLRRTQPPLVRLVGLVIAVSSLAYLLTPTSAFGLPDQPVLFALNVRYVFPALVLAIALLPWHLAGRRAGETSAALGLLGLLVVVSEASGELPLRGLAGDLPPWVADQWLAGLLAAGAVGALAWAVLAVDRGWARRPVLLALGGLGALALMAAGWVDQRYADGRYRDDPVATALRAAEPTTVALAGFDRQHQLYGADLDNHVQYVGEETSHGGFAEVASCDRWRSLLAAGGFEHVVVADPAPDTGPPVRWTAGWRGAAEVVRSGGLVLYALDPGSATEPCG